MSDKEIQRLAVLQDVRDQRITQVRAAEILNLSTRQITRLLHKLNQDGVSGLAHASRGQPGHRRHDDLLKSKCLSIISEHLLGFGPTLAHEKLNSMFDLNIPVETLRRWMTANGLWIPRSKRQKRPYQPRYNRDCFGELIEILMAHITIGLKDVTLNAACWFILMMPLESCCICAFVRPKRPLIICFQPEPTLSNTASLWPFIAINTQYFESIRNPSKTARSRNLAGFSTN